MFLMTPDCAVKVVVVPCSLFLSRTSRSSHNTRKLSPNKVHQRAP